MTITEKKHKSVLKTKSSTKRNVRGELKDFITRYYTILDCKVEENGSVLEITEPNEKFPQFKYVFNRNDLLKYPDSELITFNCEKINKIIEFTKKNGNFAKAFVPLELKIEDGYSKGIQKLILNSKYPEKGFIINGNIKFLNHFIEYCPFLVLILKIHINSIEKNMILKKLIVPIIDPNKKEKVDLDSFVRKLEEYFETPNPDVTNIMPIEGNLVDIDDKKIEFVLKIIDEKIKETLNKNKKIINGRLKEKLGKELKILENYYNRRISEISNKINNKYEKISDTDVSKTYMKEKNEEIEKLKNDILDLEKERDFKKTEYESIYDLTADYEVLGAAAIYIPIEFCYKCNLSNKSGNIEHIFYFNFFDGSIIPPKCACGNEINQGLLCNNFHLTCEDCFYQCKECKIDICHQCDMKKCKICKEGLCQEHYYECDSCKEKDYINYYVCNEHLFECNQCHKKICQNCSTTCHICGNHICKSNKECSVYCYVCKEYVCPEHTIQCDICGKSVCINDTDICNICHQRYSKNHLVNGKCETCRGFSKYNFDVFYNKRLNDGLQYSLNIPEYIIKDKNKPAPINFNKNSRIEIPNYMLKFELAQNKRFIILRIPKITEDFIVVYDYLTERQVLYRNIKIFGKIREIFNKERQELQIDLKLKPIIINRIIHGIEENDNKRILQCKNCNKSFKDDFKLCPYCGEKLI